MGAKKNNNNKNKKSNNNKNKKSNNKNNNNKNNNNNNDSNFAEVDTARLYAGGDGERLLAAAAAALPPRQRAVLRIATKANPAGACGEADVTGGFAAPKLREQAAESFLALKTSAEEGDAAAGGDVDLFYLHWPDREVPLEEALQQVSCVIEVLSLSILTIIFVIHQSSITYLSIFYQLSTHPSRSRICTRRVVSNGLVYRTFPPRKWRRCATSRQRADGCGHRCTRGFTTPSAEASRRT